MAILNSQISPQNIVGPEFGYLDLIGLFKDYKNPRDKITRLLNDKTIVRVKKGLYVWGAGFGGRSYSKYVLGNLIYGPSYVSKESALAFYGLIPESVPTLTSVTLKRNKVFHTPVGSFLYFYLHPSRYHVGVTLEFLDESRSILIATKEKAFADYFWFANLKRITNLGRLQTILYVDMRVEPDSLKGLRLGMLKKINKIYKMPTLDLFIALVRGLKT